MTLMWKRNKLTNCKEERSLIDLNKCLINIKKSIAHQLKFMSNSYCQ